MVVNILPNPLQPPTGTSQATINAQLVAINAWRASQNLPPLTGVTPYNAATVNTQILSTAGFPTTSAPTPTSGGVSGGVAVTPTPQGTFTPTTPTSGGLMPVAEGSGEITRWVSAPTRQPLQTVQYNGQTYVKLTDGYVLLADFQKLDSKYQSIMASRGYNAYLAQANADIAKFQADNVKLGDGSYIAKSFFNGLTPQEQQVGINKGFDALDKFLIQERQGAFNAARLEMMELQREGALATKDYIQLKDGQYMKLTDFNNLTPQQQKIGLNQGWTALNNNLIQSYQGELNAARLQAGEPKVVELTPYSMGLGGIERITQQPLSSYSMGIGKEQSTQIAQTVIQQSALAQVDKMFGVKAGDGTYYLPNAFKNIPTDYASVQKVANTLLDAGFKPADVQAARFAVFASAEGGIKTVEPGVKPPNVLDNTKLALENWVNGLAQKPKTPTTVQAGFGETAGEVLKGMGFAAVTMIPSMIGLGLTVLSHPTQLPSTAASVAKSLVQSVMTTFNPAALAIDPYNWGIQTFTTVMIVAGAKDVANIGLNTVKKVTLWIEPRGIPPSLIGIEKSTGEIPIEKLPDAENAYRAVTEGMKSAMDVNAPLTNTIPIEGSGYQLRVLTTPMERTVGNVLFHGTNEGLEFVKESPKETLGEIGYPTTVLTAGEKGLYYDPFAALQYTRGGKDAGMIMLITDKNLVTRSGVEYTMSPKYYETSSEGLVGAGKIWQPKGGVKHIETEIIQTPGTKTVFLQPDTDLFTRLTVGKESDFVTYYKGRYIPVRLGIDKELIKIDGKLPALPTTDDIYAAKLASIEITINNLIQGTLSHPTMAVKDVLNAAKQLLTHPDDALNPFRKSATDLPDVPGMRDMYLEKSYGEVIKKEGGRLRERVDTLTADKTVVESLDDVRARAYADLVRDMVDSLKARFGSEVVDSPSFRESFEPLYLANTANSLETLYKSSARSANSARSLLSDIDLRQRSLVSSVGSRATLAESRGVEARELEDLTLPGRGSGRTKEKISSITPSKPSGIGAPEQRGVPTGRVSTIQPPTPLAIPTKKQNLSPSEKRRMEFAGSTVWKQGFGWWALKAPYATAKDIAFFKTPPPNAQIVEGGAGAAYRSIQLLTGHPPAKAIMIPLGIVTVKIKQPEAKAGKSGAIGYKMNRAAKRGQATGTVRIIS